MRNSQRKKGKCGIYVYFIKILKVTKYEKRKQSYIIFAEKYQSFRKIFLKTQGVNIYISILSLIDNQDKDSIISLLRLMECSAICWILISTCDFSLYLKFKKTQQTIKPKNPKIPHQEHYKYRLKSIYSRKIRKYYQADI